MKCPKCKREIENVNVISECWQKAEVLESGEIGNYGKVEEILGTVKVEHTDGNCGADVTEITEE